MIHSKSYTIILDHLVQPKQQLRPITNSFKIWGFHGGDYEEWCLLGCYAVWLL
jgi:hypothetical protein